MKRMNKKANGQPLLSNLPAMSPTMEPTIAQGRPEPRNHAPPRSGMEPKTTQSRAPPKIHDGDGGPDDGTRAGNRGEVVPEDDRLLGRDVVHAVLQLFRGADGLGR